MIGVNPPGHFVYDPKPTDAQIRHYSDLCAKDASCSARTNDLAASMTRTAANMPKKWMFLPIDEGNVRLASFFGLMESTSAAQPLSAPMTLGAWLSAAKGDPSGFWFHVAAGQARLPRSRSSGAMSARPRGPTPARRGATSHRASTAATRSSAIPTRSSSGPVDAFSTRGRRTRATTSTAACGRPSVPTLLIGGTLDISTPAAERDEGAAPVPPERPPGRAGGAGAHDLLLELRADGRARGC